MSTLPNAHPILTQRTAQFLEGALPPHQAADLHRLVARVLNDIFGWFLCGAGTDPDADFHVAVARYHRPRLRIVTLLLQAVDDERLDGLLRSVARLSREIVDENEWKLSRADRGALDDAFRSYEQLIDELVGLIAAPPEAARLPFNVLLRATRMDLCLSASVAYLAGDIPGEVDPQRVRFSCRGARRTTADVLEAVRSVRLAEDPPRLARWREDRLRELSGAWGDEPGMEEELARIYETRLDLQQGT